jgi:mRNA-degrading endonuclease RelE of RelBE toxin-antitoxin system
VTGRAGRWNLDVRPRAPRQLARLPGKIAAAAAGVLTGPLPENPYRAGQLLRDEHAGQYSARRGPDWRVRYRIDQDTHTVIVRDISHRPDTYGT